MKNERAPSGISFAEYDRRARAAWSVMEASQLEGIVITNKLHIQYFTGHDARGADMTSFFLLLRPNEKPIMVARGMEKVSIEAESIDLEVVSYFSESEDAIPAFAKTLLDNKLQSARLGFELDTWDLTPRDVTRIQDALPELRMEDVTASIMDIIDVKSEEELEIIRSAAAITDCAYLTWLNGLRVGMSEYESEVLAKEMISKAGGDEVSSYVDFVLFGKRSALPHANASKRHFLSRGDVTVLEIGAIVKGYGGGFCRTAMFSGRDAEVENLHKIADDAVAAGIDFIRPGVTAGQVDDAVRGVVRRAGKEDCYPHRAAYGHGLGWNERGGFSGRPGGERQVSVNMVIMVTCWMFDESGRFCVAAADPIVVGETENTLLCRVPRALHFV